MDFGLDPDQRAVRDSVRKFARAELTPGYLERARSSVFPWDVHRRIADLGVFGLLAGPDHNPLDREDFVAAGLAVEELAYADFNLANAAIPVLLMSSLIHAYGSPRVRAEWLAPLVAGEVYVSFGLTEPGTGSGGAALTTTGGGAGGGRVLGGGETAGATLGPPPGGVG